MKKIFFMWLMLFAVYGHAQVLSVTDQKTGEPLASVAVISEHPRVFETTNAKGQVEVSAYKSSKSIFFRILGYESRLLTYNELDSLEFKISLVPTNLILDEVIISATRWNQSGKDIPSKVITIKPKDAALLNPQTTADLLETSGNVYIQKSQQGGGSPMIRGFATNRLLYTVDGVRMNNAIFRGGNIQNVINVDPFALESTEVVFGPGSVIYGSDAIGGVMSFNTLEPELSLDSSTLVTGKAVMRYATANNERTGHVDVNIGREKWAMVTSISHWQYDHLRQGRFGPDDYLKPFHIERIDSVDRVIAQEDPLLQVPSAYDQTNLMQKFLVKPGAHLDLEYAFHFSETSPYGRYDRHNRMRNGSPRYGEWNYGPQHWMMNQLSIKHYHPNRFYDKTSIRIAQQSFGESRISRNLNAPVRSIREESVQAYSANLDFVKSTGNRNSVFYGAEYVLNDVSSKGFEDNVLTSSRAVGPSRYPQAQWQSFAVYLSDEFKPTDKWTVQSGVRFNGYKIDAEFDTSFYAFPFTTASTQSEALTGSLGAVYRPNSTWTLSANAATAFRAPNVDDIGKVFDSEPGAVVVPNPQLRAEYAYNIDFGIAKVIAEVLKIDVTGYYTILENAMVRRPYQLDSRDSIVYEGQLSQVQAIQNAAVAEVYGVQGGVEWRLPAGFSWQGQVNYQVGREELNNGAVSPSRHAPPLFGVTRLTFEDRRLRCQLHFHFQGERSAADMPVGEQSKTEIYALDKNGNVYAPAWYDLGFSSLFKVTDQISVSGALENITNQRYRPYSSGISAPGRNFVVSVQMKF